MLAQGSLPGISAERDPALRAHDLRSYTDVYLREEIQAEALVRDIGAFARLSKDAGVSYETARRYLDVLEDTLVLFRVPAWSGSDRTSVLTHPKVLLFDIGVRNALLRRPLDQPLDDERGLLLEHLVGLELRRRCGGLWPEARLSHFRTRGGAEVDFIVEAGRELWAIEVKAARSVDVRDARGLVAFSEPTRRTVRRVLVFLGSRRQRLRDAEAIPLAEFLGELPR